MKTERIQIKQRSFLEDGESNGGIAKSIGEVIGGIRKKKKISYIKTAKLSGCGYGMVRRIEAGKNTTFTQLLRLADVFGIAFSIGYTPKKKGNQNEENLVVKRIGLNEGEVPFLEIVTTAIKSKCASLQLEKRDGLERMPLIKEELRRLEGGKQDFHLFELLNVLRTFHIVLEVGYPNFDSLASIPKVAKGNPGMEKDLARGGMAVKEERIRFFPEKDSGQEILQAIGKKIAELRGRKGKSLSQLSKSTGYSFSSLRRIELGSNMALEVFLDSANMYDVFFELKYPLKPGHGNRASNWKTVVMDDKEGHVWIVIGEAIRNARESQDLNQTQAAGKYGLNRNELSRIECGGSAMRTNTFLRLLRVFRIELIMVFPRQEKATPFDRIALTMPTFTSSEGIIRECLLTDKEESEDLPAKVGAIFLKVRTSRNAKLRTTSPMVGIDNSRLSKMEKGEIDILVGTFLQMAVAIGIGVELVYEELPQKKQRKRFGSTPAIGLVEKRVDLTRNRKPYLLAIGEAIKARRKVDGDSLREYARVLGIDNSKIGKYEKGQREIRLTTLGHILKTLKISLEVNYTLGDY